ncbi:MAG: hypothetical protein ACTHJ0_17445, partial [Flavipsychrobacter sp.]
MPHITVPVSTAAPEIVSYVRLEPIARINDVTPTISADVHDALWFLTQQWRVGEFRGIDGGTLVKAKIETQSSYINRFQSSNAANAEAIETNVPLEAKIERLPIVFDLGMQLEIGYQWYKALKSNAQDTLYHYYQSVFVIQETFTSSYPEYLSNQSSMQARLLTSGRIIDGGAFVTYLNTPSNSASTVTGVSTDSAYNATSLANAQTQFQTWFSKTYYQPGSTTQNSWSEQKLEYTFRASVPLAATNGANQTVLIGDKYTGNNLDWYSVDVDPNAADKLTEYPANSVSNATIDGHDVIDTPVVMSYIPHTIEWKGMPTGRWWQFEDANIDLAKMLTQKQDITKLILMEFGLIYSNDWLLIPHVVDNGTITQVNGLVVTDVFDQQILIKRAGSNPADNWQKWDMYENNIKRSDVGLGKLLMMPNVLNRMESEPIEKVLFLRDDMAEMIWGVEDVVPNDLFGGISGKDVYTNLLSYLNANNTTPALPGVPTSATLRYKLNNSIPENWIPFISVPNAGNPNRPTMVQRAAMIRYIDNEYSGAAIKPRTNI